MPPQNQQDEKILICDDKRFTTFPIVYDDIFALYQKQVDVFWRPEEIDMSKDYTDFLTLSQDEQYFIKMIIAYFSSSDGIVQENLASRFLSDVGISESRSFFSFQIAMENIHSHTYSLLIDTLVKDKEEKDKLFNSIENYDCIKQKSDFAKIYLTSNCKFAIRLVAFACVEGIFFSGAFCSIYWLKHIKKGRLAGLTFSNALISRDEALHVEHLVMLYKKLENKLSKSQVDVIIKNAVSIETKFICEALPCRLIGMNADLMTQYIQFCADRLAVQLGYKKIYGVSNPFSWMELISVESKTNFFEARVDSYSLATKTVDESTFQLSEDNF